MGCTPRRGSRAAALGLGLLAVLAAAVPSTGRTAHAQDPVIDGPPAGEGPSVFALPTLRAGEMQVRAKARQGDLEGGLEIAERMASRYPNMAALHVLRATLLAHLDRSEPALDALARAVDTGFADPQRLSGNRAFRAFADDPRFQDLLARARRQAQARADDGGGKADGGPDPAPVRGGEARVGPDNTVWEPRTNTLQAAFAFNSPKVAPRQVLAGEAPLADRLNRWYRDGTAAGLVGVLYDNRDRGHSRLRQKAYPQLGFVSYAEAARTHNVDYAFNDRIFFSAPTVGNASIGINGMHSVARLAMEQQRAGALLYLQYVSDHLYVYPAVRDYAPYPRDKFPANTPYLIASQGKSGSDRPFLKAVLATIAAFRPAVREALVERRLLMPTVQMILRRSLKHVTGRADYLGPGAHPPVFDGDDLDPAAMVERAHALTLDAVPPRVDLAVVSESGPARTLFTTPSAIARRMTEAGGTARFVVSAAGTDLPDGGDATVHWRVLEGDPDRIRIVPRNERGTVAALEVDWHPRRASRANPKVETDRADIGVFVEVDGAISAPAFVSVHFPKDGG